MHSGQGGEPGVRRRGGTRQSAHNFRQNADTVKKGKRGTGMDMTPQAYQRYVQQKMKKSPMGKDVCLAFVIGGAICVLGQAIQNGWAALGLSREDAGTAASCSLVALSSLLTGLNLYNKLARFGGAGTLVPITGFSNAVTSPALDFKSED